jgi:hypothetical protein
MSSPFWYTTSLSCLTHKWDPVASILFVWLKMPCLYDFAESEPFADCLRCKLTLKKMRLQNSIGTRQQTVTVKEPMSKYLLYRFTDRGRYSNGQLISNKWHRSRLDLAIYQD